MSKLDEAIDRAVHRVNTSTMHRNNPWHSNQCAEAELSWCQTHPQCKNCQRDMIKEGLKPFLKEKQDEQGT